jgi:hypothetical protein
MKQYALLLIELTWSLFMVLHKNSYVEKMRFPPAAKNGISDADELLICNTFFRIKIFGF